MLVLTNAQTFYGEHTPQNLTATALLPKWETILTETEQQVCSPEIGVSSETNARAIGQR